MLLFQSFAAIASKTKTLTENLSQLNAPVLMTEPPWKVKLLCLVEFLNAAYA